MSIRVLIVDPDESLLDSYRDYLTAHGFEMESASTGSEGLSKLRTWKPDALVLEPDMPDDWGEKILDQLRQHPEQHCVPVLILTRRDREVIVYPVREYHVKPLSMGELAHSIRIAVKEDWPEHPCQQKRASKINA
jgi:DNA-binding response OmpR family regulator